MLLSMARGWESKAIEAQQDEARGAGPGPGRPSAEAELRAPPAGRGAAPGAGRGDRPTPGGVPAGASRHAAAADRRPRGQPGAAGGARSGRSPAEATGPARRIAASRAFLLCSVSRGLRSVPIPPRVTVETTHPLNIPRHSPVQHEGAIATRSPLSRFTGPLRDSRRACRSTVHRKSAVQRHRRRHPQPTSPPWRRRRRSSARSTVRPAAPAGSRSSNTASARTPKRRSSASTVSSSWAGRWRSAKRGPATIADRAPPRPGGSFGAPRPGGMGGPGSGAPRPGGYCAASAR